MEKASAANSRFERTLESARALPFDELIDLIDTLSAETREKRNAQFMASWMNPMKRLNVAIISKAPSMTC